MVLKVEIKDSLQMFFLQNNHQPNVLHVQVCGLSYTTCRVSLAEYQLLRALVEILFQDTRMQTSVPAALSPSVGTQRNGRLWSQTPSQGTPRCPLMVVVGPLCEPQFRQCKVVNYVCIQIWFVKFMAESCVYCCIFECISCLYYLCSSSRGTIVIVSIGTSVEKGSSN